MPRRAGDREVRTGGQSGSDPAGEGALRELVAAAGQVLYQQELTDYLGHCSARVPGTDRVVIKPKHSPAVRSPAGLGAADAVYEGYPLILVRPDLHVAWRGHGRPPDPGWLAATVTGHEPGIS
jgi:hypothetical protein